MPHTCHANACTVPVPPKMFMCRPHWFSLPLGVRKMIWRHYRPGQEIDKHPTAEYVRVAKQAIALTAPPGPEEESIHEGNGVDDMEPTRCTCCGRVAHPAGGALYDSATGEWYCDRCWNYGEDDEEERD